MSTDTKLLIDCRDAIWRRRGDVEVKLVARIDAALAKPAAQEEEMARKLRVAAVIMSGLPELPDYNGSILKIDDVEAEKISRDLSDVADWIAKSLPIQKEEFPKRDSSEERQWLESMANSIAANTAHNECARLEVAYAIARYLNLDWPSVNKPQQQARMMVTEDIVASAERAYDEWGSTVVPTEYCVREGIRAALNAVADQLAGGGT